MSCITMGLSAWVIMVGLLAGEGRADFVLYDDEQATVTTSHSTGTLYDTSQATVAQGGYIDHAYTYDGSGVDITTGTVNVFRAYDASTVNQTGGLLTDLLAYGTCDVDISGDRRRMSGGPTPARSRSPAGRRR